MNTVSRALAGLLMIGAALTGSPPAWAAKNARSAGPKTSQPQRIAPDSTAIQSPDATRVADWIAASGDNNDLPYAIIDKKAAALLLFDAKGEKLGQVPVLLGIAPGDDASPGIGSKNLSEIGPAEKTTPAGRFLAKFGVAAANTRVLWVDYATSVALHPIPRPGKPKERRRERMLSPTSEDNRITFGCINVPIAFYTKTISPLFRKRGGYVYVTPDMKPLEEVFPRIRMQSFANTGN
ncbi:MULTISPECIES: hypothetical protein [Novosphingobium]|jgi:hypothetical protein|uniref:hypothetical protein n=1 Tax=Novosphingobium TaxID=165696 RepID=UPI0022F2A0FB|nr:hypothetical protein [Novosphingobium resinovorum]GLK46172.1 hypothetical protein GCM10017612_40940 [Novosphingobium resinovorum]